MIPSDGRESSAIPQRERTTFGRMAARRELANHAHSVWRDPTADFGLDVLARHRRIDHGSTP